MTKFGAVYRAIVVNTDDPEQAGRVQVQLPWLGVKAIEWARVVRTGRFPGVGEEVLVAFEAGEISHPYVIGTLWDGDDSPD